MEIEYKKRKKKFVGVWVGLGIILALYLLTTYFL